MANNPLTKLSDNCHLLLGYLLLSVEPSSTPILSCLGKINVPTTGHFVPFAQKHLEQGSHIFSSSVIIQSHLGIYLYWIHSHALLEKQSGQRSQHWAPYWMTEDYVNLKYHLFQTWLFTWEEPEIQSEMEQLLPACRAVQQGTFCQVAKFSLCKISNSCVSVFPSLLQFSFQETISFIIVSSYGDRTS